MKDQIKGYSVIVEINGKTYESEIKELNENEFNELQNLVLNAAEGKLTYLRIETDEGIQFFPSALLSEAIITIKS